MSEFIWNLGPMFENVMFWIFIGLAIYSMACLFRKIIQKIRKGDILSARESAYRLADKMVDFLIDVIEKYDIETAKRAVEKESKKDKEIETNIKMRLENRGYNKRKSERGN